MPSCGGNFNDLIGTFCTLAKMIFYYPGYTSKTCPFPFPLKFFFNVKLILLNYLNKIIFTIHQSLLWIFYHFFHYFLRLYMHIHLAGIKVSMISTFNYCYNDFFYDFLHAIRTFSSKNLDIVFAIMILVIYILLNRHLLNKLQEFFYIYELDQV